MIKFIKQQKKNDPKPNVNIECVFSFVFYFIFSYEFSHKLIESTSLKKCIKAVFLPKILHLHFINSQFNLFQQSKMFFKFLTFALFAVVLCSLGMLKFLIKNYLFFNFKNFFFFFRFYLVSAQDPDLCPANETYNSCGKLCIQTCQNRNSRSFSCLTVCKAACFCNPGFIRDTVSGACVKPSDCPTSSSE